MDDEEYNEEDPLNMIGLETKILSYSEKEKDENNDELSFNITIKPIHNIDSLKELQKEIFMD